MNDLLAQLLESRLAEQVRQLEELKGRVLPEAKASAAGHSVAGGLFLQMLITKLRDDLRDGWIATVLSSERQKARAASTPEDTADCIDANAFAAVVLQYARGLENVFAQARLEAERQVSFVEGVIQATARTRDELAELQKAAALVPPHAISVPPPTPTEPFARLVPAGVDENWSGSPPTGL